MPVAAAVIGLPGWIGAIVLLGLRLRPAASFPLVVALVAESADALLGVNWPELWGPNIERARAALAEALTHGVAAFEAPAPTLKGNLRRRAAAARKRAAPAEAGRVSAGA